MLLQCLGVMALAVWMPLSLAAQATAPPATAGVLVDAPGAPASQPAGSASTVPGNSATISGTVMDTNGSEVEGARVALSQVNGGAKPLVQLSRSNGEFTFSGLPAGKFKLTVSGKDWGTVVSSVIQLHAAEYRIIRQIILPLTASASIRVVADPEVLAEEQVQIAEQQRVLGIFPNFYTSFDWNAPPMGTKQKFQLVGRSLIDPMTFAGAGAIAGLEQYTNAFSGYGSGVSGYSKRFAAAYADDLVGRVLSQAALPSLFHQDPRYFYRGTGSVHSRAFYAMAAAVMARRDNGHWGPNYSRILGSFAAGGISNLYHPAADRGFALTTENALIDIGGYAGTNLVREFFLKKLTTRAAKDTNP